MTPAFDSAPRRHIAIVGGGIAGLSVAHALREQGTATRGIDVSVLERAPRPGGHIHTENVDGFLLSLIHI